MKALTLWRPWTVLIARGIKRVENRPWAPGRRLAEGERFAIHAGKKWDPGCVPMAQRLGVPLATFDEEVRYSAVVAVVTFAGLMTNSNDPWFFGPFGWILEDVVRLSAPVPCAGAQGLWRLPVDVEAVVMAQVSR